MGLHSAAGRNFLPQHLPGLPCPAGASQSSLLDVLGIFQRFYRARAFFLFYRPSPDEEWFCLCQTGGDTGVLYALATGSSLVEALNSIAAGDGSADEALRRAMSTLFTDLTSLIMEPVGPEGGVCAVGVLAVSSRRPLLTQSKDLFRKVVENMLAVLACRVYRQQLTRTSSDLEALVRLSQAITSTSGLETILSQIIYFLKTIIGAESGGVLLYDPEQEALVLKKPAFGIIDQKPYRLFLRDAENPGSGASLYVFRTLHPHIANFPREDEVTNQELIEAMGARNSLTVPLITDGRGIGALHLINKRGGGFTPEDARLLSLLASQVAVLIYNASLLQQLETKNDSLKKTFAFHNQLMDLVLLNKDLTDITGTLSGMIGRPVVLEDPSFRLLSFAPSYYEVPGIPDKVRRDPLFLDFLRALGRSRSLLPLPSSLTADQSTPRLMTIISAGEQVLGYLSVLNCESLEEPNSIALEQSRTILALKIMQQKIALEVEERINGEFLRDLFTADIKPDGKMTERMAFIGLDLRKTYQILLIYCSSVGRSANYSKNDENGHAYWYNLVQICRNTLEEQAPESVAGITEKGVVLVVNIQGTWAHKSAINDLAAILLRRVYQNLPELKLQIAIGIRATGIKEMRKSYAYAAKALTINKSLSQPLEVTSFDRLGVYRLLFDVGDNTTLKNFAEETLGPLLHYDRGNSNNLLTTLKTYIENNLSPQDTCKSLFIHPNTLKYRLGRIKELAGIDLNDSEIRLNVQTALKIMEIPEKY